MSEGKEYEFEIQSLITVKIKGTDKEDARAKLIPQLHEYGDDLIDKCCVSDGVEKQ